MIKAVIILGLAAIASAQVLRISPVVLGSSTAGALQVIQLGQGGSVSPYRVQASQVQTARVQPAVRLASAPVSSAYVQQVRPVQIVATQPQYVATQPQFVATQPQYVATQPQVVRYQAAPVSFQAAPVQVTRQTVPVSAARYEVEAESRPSPFAYSFDSEDEFGTKIGRSESSDEQGVVTGSYSLSSADGIARVVQYIADAQGFRATVRTNEPGTLTSEPADVKIESSAAPARR